MDFYLQYIRFRTDLAVNAKSCLNSNFMVPILHNIYFPVLSASCTNAILSVMVSCYGKFDNSDKSAPVLFLTGTQSAHNI